MKRRFFSVLVILLVMSFSVLPCAFIRAEEDILPQGEWVRVDTQTYHIDGSSNYADNPDDYTDISYSCYPMDHDYSYRKWLRRSDEDVKSTDFTVYSRCGFPGAYGAPEYVQGGQTVDIELSADCSIYENEFGINETVSCTVSLCDPASAMTGFTGSDTAMCRVSSASSGESDILTAAQSLTFPENANAGERIAISFRSTGSETRWIYEWKTNEVPEDVKAMGTWKLVESYVHVPDQYTDEYRIKYGDGGPDDVYHKVVSYSGTETSHSFSSEENDTIAKGTVQKHYSGSWSFSVSAPPASFTAGQAFQMSISSSHDSSRSFEHATASIESTDKELWWPYRGELEISAFDAFTFRGGHSVNEESPSDTATILAPIPEYPNEEHYCGVRFMSNIFIKDKSMPDSIYTDWIYKWEPSGAAANTTGNGEGEGGGDEAGTPEPVTPSHAVVNKDADKDPGESGTKIPTGVLAGVLGGAAAAGGGAAVAAKSARKGKDGENKEKKEDDISKSTFEMRVRKDFGDTISVDEEVWVYARIVEITEAGVEKDRPDLTSRISISSPDYLKVKNEQMSGQYKAASVLALGGKPDEVPDQAKVSFFLGGPEGSFTENVIFKIANPCIVFGQDNLTLPAGYDGQAELLFIVYGMEPTDISAKVRGDDYEVELRVGDVVDGVQSYYAVITEKCKTPLEVAETTQSVLTITAKHVGADGKERKLEEKFYLYRMGMGIALDVSDIGCYRKKNGEPAVTKAHILLFTWNEETNEIVRAAVAPKTFRALHWYTDEAKSAVSDDTSREMQMVENLGLGICVPKDAKVDPEKGLECELRCTRAVLDSPQVLRCDIEITAEYEGKLYQSRKEYVRLTSQPRRRFETKAEEDAALKKDKVIREWLESTLAAINSYGMEAQLYPMVTLMNLMLKNYNRDFGYDPARVEQLRKAYTHVLEGMKAADDAELRAMDELASTFLGKCAIVADYAKQCEDSMSLGTRMLLGVCTLGGSEAALLTCQVYREMREAAMKSDNTWTAAFCAGVKVVAVEALIDYATGKAMTYGKRQLAKMKAAAPDINAANKAAKQLNGSPDKSIASKLNAADGSRLKAAGEQSAKAAREAREAAEKAVEAAKKFPLSEADEAFERGVEIGREKLEKMAAAQGEEFAEWAMSVQMDKYSLAALKRMKGDAATELRARFNKVIMAKNDQAVQMTKEALAKQFGCPVDQIRTFKASSNTVQKLKSGATTTFDLDVSYQFISKDGTVHDIAQKVAEPLHLDACYKSYHGVPAPSPEAARKFAIGVDHSVVQKGSLENYGSESVLGKIIDSTKQGQVMTGAEAARAGETIAYKGTERISRSREWVQKALTGDTPQVREAAFKAAAMEKAEGYRQIVKQAEYLMSKDVIGMSRGSNSCISQKLRVAWETMRKVGEGTLSPDKAEQIIKNACGMDAEQVCRETGRLLSGINDSLAGTAKAPDALKSLISGLKNEYDNANNS